MSAADDPSRPTGTLLAERYRIGRHIGDGRMGEVYVGKDLETNMRVALKLLHQPLCAVKQQVLRFDREFRLTEAIDHPNVVTMYAFGQQPDGLLKGRHYLVLEYLEGRGLDEILIEGPLEPAVVAHISAQVADALAAVHERGVVHRDLKPGNIQVLSRGTTPDIKVLDFGLGRLQGGDSENLTDVGIRLGTVEYMAPEYISRHQLDAQSDIYSLGCVMYQMLTGRPPYKGRSMAVMHEHVSGPVLRPSSLVPVPPWLDDLVSAMLAKDPKDRPMGAAEVRDRIRSLAEAPEPRVRSRPPRPPMQSLPPSEGLGSVAHLNEDRPSIYPDPRPKVPTTPILVTIGLLAAGVMGMGVLGFAIGAVLLSL